MVDPIHRPEATAVRDVVRGWRFYDSFRVDPDAPARQPQVGTRTEVLAADGHELANHSLHHRYDLTRLPRDVATTRSKSSRSGPFESSCESSFS